MRRGSLKYRDDVVDPPAVEAIGGNGDDRAPVESADTGGGVGLNHATAWDVLAGRAQCVTDLQDFLHNLNESPDLRAAATLRSLTRIRSELERLPEDCELGDPVVLKAQDVILIARQLMSRLR